MTVSLTSADSSSTNPPTPSDMTSTSTTPPSPPVPQSSNTAVAAAIDAPSSPSSVTAVKESNSLSAANSSVDSIVEEVDNSMAHESNQGDETEDETGTEFAGDDEGNSAVTSAPINDSDQCSAPTSANKRSLDSDHQSQDDTLEGAISEQCNKKALVDRETENKTPCASVLQNSPHELLEASPVKCHSENESISTEDVAEMARKRAAKFIQERTKMACLFNSSSEPEPIKPTTNHTNSSLSHQSSGSSRKRKLTVKDILVSQRTRESGAKQQRTHNESQLGANNLIGGLNHVFPGMGQILDPSLQQMSEANNPFAAISAAIAAAAASSNGSNSNGLTSSSTTNAPSGLVSGLVGDSQSAYISSLAQGIAPNANPTAALALMASLSAMMQNSANKEATDSASSAVSAATNPLVSLESTFANVMANNFGQPTQSQANNVANDDDDEDDDRIEGHVPLDFSIKSFPSKEDKSTGRRKSRKKLNGENATEEETPLDLSLSTKRPDEHCLGDDDKQTNPLFSQLANMDNNTNGSNFAAMAAAAAAAAAAASFSPNLLSKMAASIAPWSNYGMQQNPRMVNDSNAAAAAFQALFQQMNNSSTTNKSNSINQAPNAAMFQSFPDLYWNGKLSGKTPTSSPSYGVLSNSSVASLSARHHHHHHHQPPPAASQPMRTKSSSGRQNPWQAQWINRSSEQTRDVFTCVWCKESFKSLAEMTDHMKRSPRCGMAGMQQHHSHHHTASSQVQSTPSTGATSQSTNKLSLGSPNNTLSVPVKESNHSHSNSSSGGSSSNTNNNHNNTNANMMGAAATNSALGGSSKPSGVSMPRKLVRGQDVWLGRGAEQTRQILKCMWCGQSFKSLADMTQHMKVTQHYTNIISQEQITSWRTPDEKMGHSQVNAVLTCKVCDEAFSSLKELSNHMVKNSHFKDNSSASGTRDGRDGSGRSTPTSTPVPASAANSRSGRSSSGAPSSDRRKKSLPVRKLLELERGEFKRSGDDEDDDELPKSQLIECDDCHDKIEPRCFLQHIKQCRTRSNAKSDPESDKSKIESDKTIEQQSTHCDSDSNRDDQSDRVKNDDLKSDKPNKSESDSDSKPNNENRQDDEPASSGGSVLSALEKLIEKNFDTRSRRTQQTGILQRLGIDEEVFPPWQNMTPSPLSAMSPSMTGMWNTMNGVEFSRSNSSSSNNSRVNSVGGPAMPQLRYRRNSSSALAKEKFLTGLNASLKASESNGSFSSQETEEEESCDESNSDCGSRPVKHSLFSVRSQQDKTSRLNFPISSMLSSPVPARPTSASSSASSISHSEPVTPSQMISDQLHRMTPSSHRSGQDEEDDENDMSSPLELCKKSTSEKPEMKKSKVNGLSDNPSEESESCEQEQVTHNPLLQLQKLLDKTDNSARNSVINKVTSGNINQRVSPFVGWPESANSKSPASSPRTPPIHSPSSTKSDEAMSYLARCAFCDVQVSSRNAYRSHLIKAHLAMRDSSELATISDEELLLLVLAKSSSLPLVSVSGNSGGHRSASAKSSSTRPKESRRKSAKSDTATWDKSPNNSTSSPSQQLESSQSKFLKYAELAKQLSSKYA